MGENNMKKKVDEDKLKLIIDIIEFIAEEENMNINGDYQPYPYNFYVDR
jgi:hypothetical protein